jgi:uncharacterized membrane protein
MSYLQLAYFHLGTIIPAFFMGTYLLINRKGTSWHKLLGKIYMGLMLFTAMITLFMPAKVGPPLLGHFGFIHIFSLSVFFTVPTAFVAVRNGNIKAHRGNMLGLYFGGLLIAGSFAFMPGRLLYGWLFT